MVSPKNLELNEVNATQTYGRDYHPLVVVLRSHCRCNQDETDDYIRFFFEFSSDFRRDAGNFFSRTAFT